MILFWLILIVPVSMFAWCHGYIKGRREEGDFQKLLSRMTQPPTNNPLTKREMDTREFYEIM